MFLARSSMNKKLSIGCFLLTLSVIYLSLIVSTVSASGDQIYDGEPVYGGAPVYGGTPVYGGGVIVSRGEMLLDKKVKNPATGEFVDHLGPTDPKYKAQSIVTFQIVLRNAGEQTIDTISVVDTLPKYLDFMSGPGSYDKEENTLTFTVENLAGGTSQTFEVKGRVVHPALLPEDKNIICPTSDERQPVNVVNTFIDKGQEDHDESQYCIERELEVPQIPQAGPEVTTFLGLGISLVAGVTLRKKNK